MTTKAALIAQVQSYLNNRNPDFVAAMDTFIANAEKRITFGLRIPSARATVTGNLVIGQPTFVVPSTLRSVFSLAVISGGAYTYLIRVQPDFMQAVYPNPTVLGMPSRYAIQDATRLVVGPSPDQAYQYELVYEDEAPSLISTPDGTWLSQRCFNALYWATIIEGYTWMKGEKDIMENYESRFGEAMAQAQLLVDGRLKNDDFRDGDDRLPKRGPNS